jgi:hypothetical protein
MCTVRDIHSHAVVDIVHLYSFSAFSAHVRHKMSVICSWSGVMCVDTGIVEIDLPIPNIHKKNCNKNVTMNTSIKQWHS